MTICIQIGNSDNRLSQAEWSDFCYSMSALVKKHAEQVYFHGFSQGGEPWQNACWILACRNTDQFQQEVKSLRKKFRQHSVAWMTGQTVLL